MELEKLLEKADKLKEGINDKWNKIKALPEYKGMTDDQIMMKAAAKGQIEPEEIDKLALNNIRKEDFQKAKQAAQAKKEGKTPEQPAEGEQPADNTNQENQEQSANGDNNTNDQNQEGEEQPANNGNSQPEFFKDFEGKAQVSPDDIKAVLSDPTKGQQLIDWAKTQNAIVKEVTGLQNVMKAAQANGNNQNGGDAQNGGDQAANGGDTAQNGGNEQKAAPQRPFTDYLEPLGKIMKTQADCDKAIEFFTNLKNTKPAAAEGNSEAPAQETAPAN